MATATRAAKKLNRSNQEKKNFARAAHFFVHFFVVGLHDYNVKHLIYTSYVGNVVNAPRMFFHFCSGSLFFSVPLIFTLLAASISHFLTTNFHVLYQRNSAPLFLSNALALSLLSTSAKTLQLSPNRLCCFFIFSL